MVWCSTVHLSFSILAILTIVYGHAEVNCFDNLYTVHTWVAWVIKFPVSKLLNKRLPLELVEWSQTMRNSWRHRTNFGIWTNLTLALCGRSPIRQTPVPSQAPTLGLSLIQLLWGTCAHPQIHCASNARWILMFQSVSMWGSKLI